jgi:hypothetical protein
MESGPLSPEGEYGEWIMENSAPIPEAEYGEWIYRYKLFRHLQDESAQLVNGVFITKSLTLDKTITNGIFKYAQAICKKYRRRNRHFIFAGFTSGTTG